MRWRRFGHMLPQRFASKWITCLPAFFAKPALRCILGMPKTERKTLCTGDVSVHSNNPNKTYILLCTENLKRPRSQARSPAKVVGPSHHAERCFDQVPKSCISLSDVCSVVLLVAVVVCRGGVCLGVFLCQDQVDVWKCWRMESAEWQ